VKGLKRQSDLEQLSAWMDGELSGPDARRVARLVQTDPDWRSSHEEFQRLDAVLQQWSAPPPPQDLTARILRAVRSERLLGRALRIGAAAVAAAACIAVALVLIRGRPDTPIRAPEPRAAVESQLAGALADIAPEDRFAVENLQMLRELPEVQAYREIRDVADAETLAILAELEARRKPQL